MGNPIFNMMNNNNMAYFMQLFNRFKNMFQGNPEEQVKSIIASGQMSKEQFEQFSNMAEQFQAMMGQRR